MTVQEMIAQMGECVFEQSFQNYLSATCQMLPGMDFLTEEDGYKATMDRGLPAPWGNLNWKP